MDEENPKLFNKIKKLIDMLFIEPNPIGINTLMMMLGLCKPNFRLPYIELDLNLRNELKKEVEKLGIENFLSKDGNCKNLDYKEFNYIKLN